MEAFFLAEIFGKETFDPYNFWITIVLARKSDDEKFLGDKKYAYIYHLNSKIRLTMLCLSGFELYSGWVPPMMGSQGQTMVNIEQLLKNSASVFYLSLLEAFS